MRRLPLLALVTAVVSAIFAACSPEKKHYVPSIENGNVTPTMTTTDVSTLISDSGYTRYHLTTPVWQIFEDADTPFWRFPEGLEVEQYDLHMQPTSNVVCDSAIYFSQQRLWRLDGNVVMVNTQADSFLTQQLFWDQTERKIYTDSFIHIVRTDRVIEGYGMQSDQNMLYYTVTRPTAILPANSLPGGRRDSSASKPASQTQPAPQPEEKPAATSPANEEAAHKATSTPEQGKKTSVKRLTPKRTLSQQNKQ